MRRCLMHHQQNGRGEMRNRMDVIDRFEHDPAFRSLVDLMTHWLLGHPDVTPTELREAAMCAASRVDAMTVRRRYVFDKDGTFLHMESERGQP